MINDTVVGLDPGPKNFGYAAVSYRINKDSVQYKVHESGKIAATLQDLKSNVPEQFAAYVQEIDTLLQKYSPSIVVIERFQSRGLRGTNIEFVCMMIALVVEHLRREYPNVVVFVPTAVTWKSAVNRKFKLDKAYRFSLTEPHELDAALMTGWAFSKYRNIHPFDWFTTVSCAKTFIKLLEAVARGKKKRKRLK